MAAEGRQLGASSDAELLQFPVGLSPLREWQRRRRCAERPVIHEHSEQRWIRDRIAGRGRDDPVHQEPPRLLIRQPEDLVRVVVRGLEEKRQGKTLLLVSHADPIQALMAAFAGLELSQWERIVPLGYAEFAELYLGMPLRIRETKK